jgi:hypothetical protein
MGRKTLHLFGHQTPDGGTSAYDDDVQCDESRFFICDTRDDLPDNPADMDFALNKERSVLLVGNNGNWVRINPISE